MAGKGYIVQYRQNSSLIGSVGIPYDWFTYPAAKAELVYLPKGKNWPYMSVFYKDGEFSHLRLYAHRHKSHQTWDVTPTGVDVSSFFPESDTLVIQY
jgi:hypothetical protein